jgi:hypothetical protein
MTYNFRNLIVHAVQVAAVLGVASVALHAENVVKKIVVGDREVTVVTSYNRTEPLPRPTQAIVYDFDLPTNVITLDHSATEYVDGHGLVAHVKGDVGRDSSIDSVATNVKREFSKTLVKRLNKSHIATTGPATEGQNSPTDTLIVHGEFTTLKRGNKTERMLIGFGLGASDVKAHVVVSLTTEHGPIVLAEFDLNFSSDRMPGALVGPPSGLALSVATSAVTDHGSTAEKDTALMAKAVAKQIEKIMKTQQWTDSTPLAEATN